MNDELRQRRAQDTHPPSLDIQQMIIAEGDPRQRASLIVLHAISLSLEANTTTVQDISIKLEKHLEVFNNHSVKEQELMGQGRLVWKIMAWMLTIAQLIGVGLWNEMRTEQKETQKETSLYRESINSALQAGRNADAKIESRLGVMEQTK